MLEKLPNKLLDNHKQYTMFLIIFDRGKYGWSYK